MQWGNVGLITFYLTYKQIAAAYVLINNFIQKMIIDPWMMRYGDSDWKLFNQKDILI